jgi:hypothetical protein
MHGQDTPVGGQFAAEIVIMQEMHWSWSELLEAPVLLVEEIAERVRARNHWQRVKADQDKAMSEQRKTKARYG